MTSNRRTVINLTQSTNGIWANEFEKPTQEFIDELKLSCSKGHYFGRDNTDQRKLGMYCISEGIENGYNGAGYSCDPNSDYLVMNVQLRNGMKYLVQFSEARPAKDWYENTVQALMPGRGEREGVGTGKGTGTYQDGMGYTESNLVTKNSDKLDSFFCSAKKPFKTWEEACTSTNWNISRKQKQIGLEQLKFSMILSKEDQEGLDLMGNGFSIASDSKIVDEILEIICGLQWLNKDGSKVHDRRDELHLVSKTVMRICAIHEPNRDFNLNQTYFNGIGLLTDLDSPVIEGGKKTIKKIRIIQTIVTHGTVIEGNYVSRPYSLGLMMDPTKYSLGRDVRLNNDPYLFFKKDRFNFDLKNVTYEVEDKEKNTNFVKMNVNVLLLNKTDYFTFRTSNHRRITQLISGGRIGIPAKGGRYKNTAVHLMTCQQSKKFVDAIINKADINNDSGYVEVHEQIYSVIDIQSVQTLNPLTNEWDNTPDIIKTGTDFQLTDSFVDKVEEYILDKISCHIDNSDDVNILTEKEKLIKYVAENYWVKTEAGFRPIGGSIARNTKSISECKWFDAWSNEEIKKGDIKPEEKKEKHVYAFLTYDGFPVAEEIKPYWEQQEDYPEDLELVVCYTLECKMLNPKQKSELIASGEIDRNNRDKTIYDITVPNLFQVKNYCECKLETKETVVGTSTPVETEKLTRKEYEANPGFVSYFPKFRNAFLKGMSLIYFPDLDVPRRTIEEGEKEKGNTAVVGNTVDKGITNYWKPFSKSSDSPILANMAARLQVNKIEINSEDEVLSMLFSWAFGKLGKDIVDDTDRFYLFYSSTFCDYPKYLCGSLTTNGKFGIERKFAHDSEYRVTQDDLINCKLNHQIGCDILRMMASWEKNTTVAKSIGKERMEKIENRAKELKMLFEHS